LIGNKKVPSNAFLFPIHNPSNIFIAFKLQPPVRQQLRKHNAFLYSLLNANLVITWGLPWQHHTPSEMLKCQVFAFALREGYLLPKPHRVPP